MDKQYFNRTMIVDNLKEILDNLEVFQECLKTEDVLDCYKCKYFKGSKDSLSNNDSGVQFNPCIPHLLVRRYDGDHDYKYSIYSLIKRENFIVDNSNKKYISLEKFVQLKNLKNL